MARQDRINELHQKHVAPVEAAARQLFGSPNGQKVLDALDRAFGIGAAYLPGGGVDPHGTLVRVGHAEVITYLRDLAKAGQGE